MRRQSKKRDRHAAHASRAKGKRGRQAHRAKARAKGGVRARRHRCGGEEFMEMLSAVSTLVAPALAQGGQQIGEQAASILQDVYGNSTNTVQTLLKNKFSVLFERDINKVVAAYLRQKQLPVMNRLSVVAAVLHHLEHSDAWKWKFVLKKEFVEGCELFGSLAKDMKDCVGLAHGDEMDEARREAEVTMTQLIESGDTANNGTSSASGDTANNDTSSASSGTETNSSVTANNSSDTANNGTSSASSGTASHSRGRSELSDEGSVRKFKQLTMPALLEKCNVVDLPHCTDLLQTFVRLFTSVSCGTAQQKRVLCIVCDLLDQHIGKTSAGEQTDGRPPANPTDTQRGRTAANASTNSISNEATPYFRLTKILSKTQSLESDKKRELIQNAKDLIEKGSTSSGIELLTNVMKGRIPSMEELVDTLLANYSRWSSDGQKECLVKLWCVLRYYTDIMRSGTQQLSATQEGELRRIRSKITQGLNLRSPKLSASTNRKKVGVHDQRSNGEKLYDGIKQVSSRLVKHGLQQGLVTFQPSSFVSNVLFGCFANDFVGSAANFLDRPDEMERRRNEHTPDPLGAQKTKEDIWDLIQLSFTKVRPSVGDPDVDPDSLVFYYTVNTRGEIIDTMTGNEDGRGIIRADDEVATFDADGLRLVTNAVIMRREYKRDADFVRVAKESQTWYRPFLAKFMRAVVDEVPFLARANATILFDLMQIRDEQCLELFRRLWRAAQALDCTEQYIGMLQKFTTAGKLESTFPYSARAESFGKELDALRGLQAGQQDVLHVDYAMRMQDVKRKQKWFNERASICTELARSLSEGAVHSTTIASNIDRLLRTTPPQTLSEVIRQLCSPTLLEKGKHSLEFRRRRAYFLLEFLVDMCKDSRNTEGANSFPSRSSSFPSRSSSFPSRASSNPSRAAIDNPISTTGLYQNSVVTLRKAIAASDLIAQHSTNHQTLAKALHDLRSNPSAHSVLGVLQQASSHALEFGHASARTGESAMDSVLRLCGLRSSEDDAVAPNTEDDMAKVHVTADMLHALVQGSYDTVSRTPEEIDTPQSYGDLVHAVRKTTNAVFNAEGGCADYYNHQLRKFKEQLMNVHIEDKVLLRRTGASSNTTRTSSGQRAADNPDVRALWNTFTGLKTALGTNAETLNRLNRPAFQKALELENKLIEISRLTPGSAEATEKQRECGEYKPASSSRLSRSHSTIRSRSRSRTRRQQEETELNRMDMDMAKLQNSLEKLERAERENTAELSTLQDRERALTQRIHERRSPPSPSGPPSSEVAATVRNTIALSRLITKRSSVQRQLRRSRRKQQHLKDRRRELEEDMAELQRRSDYQLQFYMSDPDFSLQELEPDDQTQLRLGQCAWPDKYHSTDGTVSQLRLQDLSSEKFKFGNFDRGFSAGVEWRALREYYSFKISSDYMFTHTKSNYQIFGFFIGYDAEKQQYVRTGTKASGRYTYFLNYLVRYCKANDNNTANDSNTANNKWKVCEIGYAGNLKYTKKSWIEEGILPDKLRDERGLVFDKSVQSTGFILKNVAWDFLSALQFCHSIMKTKRGDRKSFYLNPSHTSLDGRSMVKRRRSRRRSYPREQIRAQRASQRSQRGATEDVPG